MGVPLDEMFEDDEEDEDAEYSAWVYLTPEEREAAQRAVNEFWRQALDRLMAATYRSE